MADEHNVKINISGNESGAVGSLSRVKVALSSVSKTIGDITAFLGRLNWAMSAVQTVIEGIKKLREWSQRAVTEVRNLREEMARTSYATAVAHAAASYEKLNRIIAETNRLEKERNEIISARKSVARDIEDARVEQAKQEEIAKLDPNEQDYAARRKEIERKYSILSSDMKAARADEDTREKAEGLYRAADAKDKEANLIKRELDKQEKIVEKAVEAKWKAGMEARGGDEQAVEKAKEAEKAFEEAFDRAKKIRDAMEEARKEAESLRRRAGEALGGNLSARMMNEANKKRIENERKAEQAQENSRKAEKDKEIDKADRDWKDQKAYEESKKEIQAAVDEQPLQQNKISILKAQEENASDKASSLRKEYDAEMKKDPGERDAEKLSDLRSKIDRYEADAENYRQQRQNIVTDENNRKIQNLEDFSARASSVDEVSQNRLTAMGLGSGVKASGEVQRELRTLADLLREEIRATKENKPQNQTNVSVYAD